MRFYLTKRADGKTDLIRERPEIVGTFPDAVIAKQVLDMLVNQAMDEGSETQNADTIDQKVPAFSHRKASVSIAEHSQPPLKKPKKPKAMPPEQSTSTALVVSQPGQLDAAFERIRNGEKLSDVAKALDMEFGSLRSKWANHQRYLKATVNRDATSNCTLCAKQFVPSSISPDKCARCSRD
tara:strand:+ start:285 stop:827 length:543 start_codon:yes stop_codon:yes gene_type:complete